MSCPGVYLFRLFFSAKIIPFIVAFVRAISELEKYKVKGPSSLQGPAESVGAIEHVLLLCLETSAQVRLSVVRYQCHW